MTEGPDFLCIGAPKAGTQWLFDQLAWHPGAWMPPVKELHFFDRGAPKGRRQRFQKRVRAIRNRGLDAYNAKRSAELRPPLGERDVAFFERLLVEQKPGIDFDWYRQLFSGKGSDITADFTPAYCALPPDVVHQIAKALPELKIVFLARDPVARAWSHLQMEHRYERLALGDLGAIRTFLGKPEVQMRSQPTATVRLWREAVGTARFHLAFFDDIVRAPVETRRSIMEFVGLDPARAVDRVPPDFNRKSDQPKFPLPPELKALLVDVFRDELARCAQELGGPALRWQKLYAETA